MAVGGNPFTAVFQSVYCLVGILLFLFCCFFVVAFFFLAFAKFFDFLLKKKKSFEKFLDVEKTRLSVLPF